MKYRRAQISAETGAEKCVVGGNRSRRFAGGNRGEIGGDPSVSALRHAGSVFQGHGAGATTLSMQGLQEDLQRSNRHSYTGPSQ